MLKRYHAQLKRPMIVIKPGEYYVTRQDEVIATVLGSCISVCIWDAKARIGGMNHFMLPGDFRNTEGFTSVSARYGMYAMELILGDMIKFGCDREKLTAKVFGGGHVLKSVGSNQDNVPKSNIEFVQSFLDMEGITTIKKDVGGYQGRKVLFLAASGKVFVKKLTSSDESQMQKRDRKYRTNIQKEVNKESLTLF